MNMRVRFDGGLQLARALNAMPSRVSKGIMRDALRRVVAAPIRDRAAGLVRRAPGAPDIADNIVISNGRGDAQSVAVVVGPSRAVRSDQPRRSFAVQGRLLEFGFRGVMFPWLRPAFDQTALGTLKAFAAEMWSAVIRRGFGSVRGAGGGGGLQ